MTTVNRLLLVAALILGLLIVWTIKDMVTERPFEERYPAQQVECLAAILRADTYGETAAVRDRARILVADLVLRYRESTRDPNSKKDTRVSFCTILETAVTLYPEGWVHSWTFYGRSLEAIKYSKRYPGSPWDDNVKHAREAIKRGLDPSRCAVKMTRVLRRYEFLTSEADAAKELLKTMKRDQEEPGIVGAFLCPAS